jgi:hypothetical protein
MKGGKVTDGMCPMLGFNISSIIVTVGFIKTIKFCSFHTHNIKKIQVFPSGIILLI